MKKKGGVILGQGADTCVFSPKVSCSTDTEDITGETQGEFVSRIVLAQSREHILQQDAFEIIKQDLAAVNRPDLMKFFLFGASYCQPKTTDGDFKGTACKFKDSQGNIQRSIATPIDANSQAYINIVTPKYDKDIEKAGVLTESQQKTRKGIYDLMTTLTYINNSDNIVIHFDAHFGNIGWKGDQIILTDWGRVKFNNTLNAGIRIKDKPYAQFFYPITLLEELQRVSLVPYFTVIASIWDILAILGSAVKFHILGSNDAGDFVMKIFDLVLLASPKSGGDINSLQKELNLNTNLLQIKKETIQKMQPNNPLRKTVEEKIKFIESKIQEIQSEIDAQSQSPAITIPEFKEKLRNEIDNLFKVTPPAPLTTPAVEPPEALSPTDLKLIQTDLFQSTSTNSLALSPDTPKQGGRRKTRKLLQKRTRTHNIHKQTVRHSQRKGKKTTK